MKVGPHLLAHPFLLAPMAGITDKPYRQLCRHLGAAYAVSEMVASNPQLRGSGKSRQRSDLQGESGPLAVQLVGTEPGWMADAALAAIDDGANIIDINMGCPVKKVCNAWAGSALMHNEPLALRILEAVVAACEPHGVPVTLKMRTGWDMHHRNAVTLARAAEAAGVQMVVVHGRTREQGFRGEAEHDTVAQVKAALRIPVVANGDIGTPEQACRILLDTGVDAVMIGRAAQGRPWLFRELLHRWRTGTQLAPPLVAEVRGWVLEHADAHLRFYGEARSVPTFRKHLHALLAPLPDSDGIRDAINTVADSARQTALVADFLDKLGARMDRLPVAPQPAVVPQPQETWA